ncbi:2-acylglycerol O-acyltransferase 2-A [Salminus brasiliensis]|uniref:2-acylglycerol O-acyltransferase 2-A n=1 Tax=Salminus brasiliensis TaxID=930266 RepID=UPI003B83810F
MWHGSGPDSQPDRTEAEFTGAVSVCRGFHTQCSVSSLCLTPDLWSAGLVSSEKASASYLLSQPRGGSAAVVAIGGAPESLEARPGALTLQVLQRKGFIKLALKHGAWLVPVFSFGENELFDQMENPVGSTLRWIQERLQRIMGVALPLFHARGVFQYSFGLLPYRKPIHTIVGRPIPVVQNPSPTKEDIDTLHALYIQGLTELFEENKEKYGIREDQHLNSPENRACLVLRLKRTSQPGSLTVCVCVCVSVSVSVSVSECE